ncbi:alpha/beta fold hydrolase [Micromonospora sp. WMMA1976]|uniref:thioesterase II family protein n=1 Tax=Micromonospora sp. WMMA1976 TaxID=3014995 RepID=UPI00248B7DB5|nr:alpha/beta fold hydrolase [Micromonospora sp. WMMA1976]WBC06442.1 alpha/beta fold hydrolase [Micromonospora sp. WMMA1976]
MSSGSSSQARSGESPPDAAHSPWLVCGQRIPHAVGRLYCLSYAGGSGSEYARWTDPDERVEIWGLRYPGRGARHKERPFRRLSHLVTALLDEVEFEPPFALFGHSMGALVAYELTRALRSAGRAEPTSLWLSACPAPHLPRSEIPIHRLTDSELIHVLARRYGTIPQEVLRDPELAGLIVPYLRSDHEIVETYVHHPGDPVRSDTHLCYGTDDVMIPEERLTPWLAVVTTPPTHHAFSGGHFYLNEQRQAVIKTISAHHVRS